MNQIEINKRIDVSIAVEHCPSDPSSLQPSSRVSIEKRRSRTIDERVGGNGMGMRQAGLPIHEYVQGAGYFPGREGPWAP